MKKLLIALIGIFGFASIAFALPYYQQTQGLIPGITGTYYIGTSSPATLEYLGIFAKDATISNLGGSGTRCVQVDTNGKLAKASAACGSGGGGGGSGTWATTTSSVANVLLNYPLNTTDVVMIGDLSATSSAAWWYNPNTFQEFVKGKIGIGTTTPAHALSVQGNGIISGNFTAANITATGTVSASSATLTNALTVANGGTGDQSFTSSQLIYGNGTAALTSVATTTLTASSPLSLSQPVAKVGGSNSVLSLDTSGTWSGNAGTASALAANGTNCSAGNYPLGVDAAGNAESCTLANTGTVTSIATTWPITGGTITTSGTLAFAGLGTTTPWTTANLAYVSNSNTLSSVATGTITCTGNASCSTAGLSVIGGNLTINASGGTGSGLATTSPVSAGNLLEYSATGAGSAFGVATGTVTCTGSVSCGAGSYVVGSNITINGTAGSGTGLSTTSPVSAGNVLYYNGTGGGSAQGVATTSLSISGPFTIPSAIGVLTNGTVNYTGLATTSQPASSNLLVSNGGSGVYGVGTSTLSGSGPISVTAGASVIASGAISVSCSTCNTSNATVSSVASANGILGGTITTSGTLSLSSYLATSSSETAGNLAYWTTTSGTPAKLDKVATTTLTLTGFPLAQSGTLGTLVGGSDTTLVYTGLATTSQPSSSNLLVSNGGAGVFGVATATASCSGNTSCNPFTIVGSSNVTISSSGVGSGLATTSPVSSGNLLYYSGTGQGSATGVATTTLVAGTNISYSGGTPVILGSSPITINAAGGSGTFPFTPTTYAGQVVNATSTGLWLQGSPRSLIASSTFATYASSTQEMVSQYLLVGSTTPSGCSTGFGYSCGALLEVVGTDNSLNGVQFGITNKGTGNQAYTGLYLNNNLADNTVTHYGFIGLTSSNYNDTTFGTGEATSSLMFLQNTDGPIRIFASAANTSGHIAFFTGGTNSSNEQMRITSTGTLAIGSSSPTSLPGTALLLGNNTALLQDWLILATSTTMYIGTASSSQQVIYYSTSAMTLNISTFDEWIGNKTVVKTCSMSAGTAGAITWSGLHYSGNVQPGNTTQAATCDNWYISVEPGPQGSTTPWAVLTGMTSGLQ